LSTEIKGQICYAEPRVGKIVKWTEPSDLLGKKAVSVEYTITPINVVEWAKPLIAYFNSRPRKIDLVLTSEGWSTSF
jgi:hypothetical protein